MESGRSNVTWLQNIAQRDGITLGMPGYSFSADAYLKQPTQEIETLAVPMHAVLDLLHSHGFALREVLQDQFTGKPGSHSFMAVKDQPEVPSGS